MPVQDAWPGIRFLNVTYMRQAWKIIAIKYCIKIIVNKPLDHGVALRDVLIISNTQEKINVMFVLYIFSIYLQVLGRRNNLWRG